MEHATALGNIQWFLIWYLTNRLNIQMEEHRVLCFQLKSLESSKKRLDFIMQDVELYTANRSSINDPVHISTNFT